MAAASEEAALLEGGNQPMDPGFGLELERVLHLLETGREAGLLEMAVDIHEQFVLLSCEHDGRTFLWR
jgi:hypothetical protein